MTDEVTCCDQCGWPLLVGDLVTQLLVPRDVIGPVEHEWEAMGMAVVGVLHLLICTNDYAAGEPRQRTQMRRCGMAGLN